MKGGGLRKRDGGIVKLSKSSAKQSLNPMSLATFDSLPLHKGALNRRFSADRGFGFPPDRAWTSTRYACPGRERRGFLPAVDIFRLEEFTS